MYYTKNIFIVCLLVLSALMANAQSQTQIQPSQAADEKLAQIMTRNWYVIAKKCDRISQRPDVFSDGRQSSYYYSIHFRPDNNYDYRYGSFKILYNDSLNAPVREGSYQIQSQPGQNAGFRLIMDSPMQWSVEYRLDIQDEQHITLTLVVGDEQEKCDMLYAISPQRRRLD